jgi:transcriptional regulator with XRE-family HTH domain
MTEELGAWLRAQRQARGWNASEMARQLRRAAKSNGDTLPGNQTLFTYLRRWEHGLVCPSERYTLHYCTALGIEPGQFGPDQPPETAHGTAHPVVTALPERPLVPHVTPKPADAGLSAPPHVAYRWIQEPDLAGSWVEREVLMTAHEGSDHAERAERRDIGEATLEQLRADVVRLSHEYMTGEPLPLFLEMRRVRDRIYAALDRQLWPRDQTELYFLVGCLNDLMAVAADDLGYSEAAQELIRAGWAYAVAIDHRPLMAQLRLQLANITFWRLPRQSRDLALSGLEYLHDGQNAAQLQLLGGRAAARLGDADAARAAIAAAQDAREREHQDDLIEIGGEFVFSRASQHYLAGSAVIEIPSGQEEAITELEQATELYAVGPEPGEDHSHHCQMIAHADLAAVRLHVGNLEAAALALEPVLALPQARRIDSLPQRLGRVRAELASSRYQGSPQARELDEGIEEFTRDTIVGGLHELPS